MITKHRALIAILSIVVIGCLWVLFSWVSFLRTPLVTSDQGLKYTVPAGASMKFVAHDLYLLNVIKYPRFFDLLIRLKGNEHDLKAGEYLFPKGITPSRLLDQITSGTGMIYHSFTIVAGWSYKHLRRVMAEDENLQHSSLSDTDLMQELGHPELKPEGLFYPDTYFFIKGSSEVALLKRAFQLMQTKLNRAWQERDLSIPFQTPYEALIAASLVEKETGIDPERATIAGVIVNRLRKNMLLQIDPTVIYGTPNFKGKIYREDLLRDTPYNTYVHKGLPPTPIAIPSLESIQAVLHPRHHDYLYFVAKGDEDSEHQFSKNFAEHSAAIREARKKQYRPSYFNSNLVRYYFMKLVIPKIYTSH